MRAGRTEEGPQSYCHGPTCKLEPFSYKLSIRDICPHCAGKVPSRPFAKRKRLARDVKAAHSEGSVPERSFWSTQLWLIITTYSVSRSTNWCQMAGNVPVKLLLLKNLSVTVMTLHIPRWREWKVTYICWRLTKLAQSVGMAPVNWLLDR